MTDRVAYRQATRDDLTALRRVALASWQHVYSDVYEADEMESLVAARYSAERMTPLLDGIGKGETFFEVALIGDRIVGFTIMFLGFADANLSRLYLDPECIGKGIGKALFQRLEAFAGTRGIDTLWGFVHAENELAKRFYLAGGYEHIPARDTESDWYMEGRILAREPWPRRWILSALYSWRRNSQRLLRRVRRPAPTR